MLNSETKRKIDSLRDMLVGKVPDPKAQVEQITVALIYKFMDDMDKEAEEFGGKPSFFTDDWEKYAWSKMLDRRLGGDERLNLYVEATANIPKNPNIPQLFRDIFKGYFLPFRDARTLNLFLKEINEFHYDHSEDLGDAFEYLLSVLGSQGDAGQFRTPRHIIDFIVEVVDPKKTDTILDPACGTAGFLISAYKHIIKTNSSNYHPEKEKVEEKITKGKTATEAVIEIKEQYKGDKLTPDEKTRLMKNLQGYDISPDMVKLALVNLYLHGFAEPKIHEYDTLTDDKRWDDDFDVILANPPFMTPKGGSNPHNRFSIQAKRSEVLFVDYIAEHLRINGRAGIIVPEGIIFQSANAYKSLRKNLIENWGLYAVVSLPAGVFQPYSGVKTSVLLLDKQLSKRCEDILFVKIENDGFDLGAQRRAIEKNDLPQALSILKLWQESQTLDEKEKIALAVPKSIIAEAGDYNLTGDRYRQAIDYSNVKWDMVELGEVCEILDSKRKPVKKADRKEGEYPYYGASGILDYIDNYIFNERLVLIGEDGAKWEVGEKTAFIAEGKYWVNNHAHVLRPNKTKLKDTLLVELINDMDLMPHITGITVPKLNQEKLRKIKIPLPPIEVQEEIVAEIEGYQKIIDGAKQIVQNWKPNIKILPAWQKVKLGEVCDVRDGTHDSPKYQNEGIPLITSKNLKNNGIDFENVSYISQKDHEQISKRSGVDDGDVLFAMIGTIGNPIVVRKNREFSIKNVALFKFRNNEKLSNVFLKTLLSSTYAENNLMIKSRGGTQKFVSLTDLRNFEIPLPPLETQQEIVAEIEAEQKIVDANRQLIEIYENKIKSKIAEVWGEEA